MKERGLLLKPALYDATLAGRKTQTRRAFKMMADANHRGAWLGAREWRMSESGEWWARDSGAGLGPFRCPYGTPGDRLYVKEKLVRGSNGMAYYQRDSEPVLLLYCDSYGHVEWGNHETGKAWSRGWLSPLRMPKWAARLWLEITGVRVERVQDISTDDIRAEGLEVIGTAERWRMFFRELWDSINAKRGYPWADNPWVWVIDYKVAT